MLTAVCCKLSDLTDPDISSFPCIKSNVIPKLEFDTTAKNKKTRLFPTLVSLDSLFIFFFFEEAIKQIGWSMGNTGTGSQDCSPPT